MYVAKAILRFEYEVNRDGGHTIYIIALSPCAMFALYYYLNYCSLLAIPCTVITYNRYVTRAYTHIITLYVNKILRTVCIVCL